VRGTNFVKLSASHRINYTIQKNHVAVSAGASTRSAALYDAARDSQLNCTK
jgi:hypothetical protein